MNDNLIYHRRHFLKTFTFATAYSSLFGKAWTGILAAEIKPLAVSTTGILRLKVSSFPALAAESGSVRLAMNPLRGDLLPDGQFYPVVINRGPNNAFYALNSRCSHQSCAVDPMDSLSNRMTCPCHSSIYAIDGRRLSGPATSNLTRYTATFDGSDRLEIQIPGLGYSVTASNVQAAASGVPRFRLDFRAFRNVEYEVQFRESLDKAPAPVSFSTTPDGTADQNVFAATSTATVSLFVERPSATGFYMVALRVAEI